MDPASVTDPIAEYYGWTNPPVDDDPEPGRASLNAAFGSRRLHLAALDAAIVADPHGLVCGVVSGRRAVPVLKVALEDRPVRVVEVGCNQVGGRWWFQVEPGGEGITPVDEVERAPEVLAGILGREAGR
jgi:hypothetical protein